MKLQSCILSFSLLSGIFTLNAETPRWIVTPAISPDGTQIAFSYKGDIFTVPVSGGRAFQLTSNKAYDSNPVWSPDSKQIVFLSNREGSDDLFLVEAKGGTPKRYTTNSGNETPLTFLNDSTLLFNASMLVGRKTVRAPFFTQIYSLNLNEENARPKLYLSVPVYTADANSQGKILYQDRKSFEDPYRKHERSSGTSDIWTYYDGKFRQLTEFNGHDLSPVWGQGSTFYYISEKDGTLNVFEANIDGKDEKQLTHFEKHPVRALSASGNNTLAFTWDGDLYTLNPGKEPQKLDIEIYADLYDGDRVKNIVNRGVTNMAVSPDGKQVALVIRGDVYVTDNKYKTTKRITNTPEQERTVSFTEDGRTLVFDSDIDGKWQLFTATIKNPEEKEFAYATEIDIKPLYKSEFSAMQPRVSPDGKKAAFLENRDEIKVIDLTTKKVNTALSGDHNYSYEDGDITFEWSPDSEWLVTTYMGKNGWNTLDLGLVKADGSEVVNLTESGFNDINGKWALDGKAIIYATGKYGMKATGSWGNQDDIMIMALDGDAWDRFNLTEEETKRIENEEKEKGKEDKESEKSDKKSKKQGKKESTENKKEKTSFDLANRKYRTRRLSPTSAQITDFYLSPKGDKLYFIAESSEGNYNFMMTNLKKGTTVLIEDDINGKLLPDAEGENIFIFSEEEGVKKYSIDDQDLVTVSFEAPYDRHPSLERVYIFSHMAKQVEEKFYDKNLHGVDWKYYTDHYSEFLPYINNNRDFAVLMSEALGELNASHTGSGYIKPGAPMSTGALGAFFNDDYSGEGIEIAEILPRSPLSTKSSDLNSGDVIISIDGEKIGAGKDYFPMLEGKIGKKVRLGIRKKEGGEKFITVKPISQEAQSNLAYQRWVERNEHIVDSVSNGKVAYVHVRGMDTPSFQTVYDKLLGQYRNHEAVVVDTRYNGGGWLHNDLAILLSGHQYVKYSPRGKDIGIDPFSQWTKPSVMLVNESNYSDAHGTPFTYQTLGLGEVIGTTVPGTMTAVWWEYQVDPSLVFGIPQVTSVANDGTILENHQLNPDLLIYNLPGEIENGTDSQLEGATRRLLEILAKENKYSTEEKHESK